MHAGDQEPFDQCSYYDSLWILFVGKLAFAIFVTIGLGEHDNLGRHAPTFAREIED
jgi:hypothetical protein